MSWVLITGTVSQPVLSTAALELLLLSSLQPFHRLPLVSILQANAEINTDLPSVYHWASVTAGPKYGRIASFYAGWWVAFRSSRASLSNVDQVECPSLDLWNCLRLPLRCQRHRRLLVRSTSRVRP